MTKIPADIDIELAKIWLNHQDLEGLTPEEVKSLFFDAVQKMSNVNPERWD